jgi:hypothetical protein
VPFYRVRCGAGWPGVGGERAAVVVRHIGGGDGHFGGDRSGCWWGVMRGGGCSGRYRRRHACENVAAVTIDPWRKMIGWGPRVLWSGRLAGPAEAGT